MRTWIIIRQAHVSDSDSIALLVKVLGYNSTPGEIKERLANLLGKDSHAVFVAECRQDSVIGWLHVFEAHHLQVDPIAEIGGLVVHPSHQGTQVGRQLVEKAEYWAIKHGLGQVWVRSNMIRYEAAAFYDHIGYRINKIQNVFWKDLGNST